jgi:C_GCAxxG_C_C family probable redox protein
MNKSEHAKELFKKGYNCSQAVLGTFSEELGLDPKTAMLLSSSFGGGMGRMGEVCGAVSALFMVEGLVGGYDDPAQKEKKSELYQKIRDLAETFKAENGSIVCRDLLAGVEGFGKKPPCIELVGYAASLAEELLNEQKEPVK